MGLAPALYALYAGSKVKDACNEGLRGWVVHSEYGSTALILRSFQLGWHVALPVITSLSIFLRHQPLTQLSFQCWGSKDAIT